VVVGDGGRIDEQCAAEMMTLPRCYTALLMSFVVTGLKGVFSSTPLFFSA